MALLSNLGRHKDFGLLVVRIGLGIMFIIHGYPKLMGGPDGWEGLGSSTKYIGFTFLPMVFGLLAALAETLGGFLILVGLAFRPACLILTINLIVAAASHLGRGEGLMGAAHPIELAVVFLGLAFVGPGKYSVDKK
ncbi:DoxX family protein [Mucilaginibacter hurinus]|uniref:DoxX family protein n=1 Tax=Mucilaginibacter hurinus TaxID=2201324 RepID=A0A367GRK4_9SPHI|nr:DoxX family protein [Mucilaginibacter hurinus]RCH55718.1 DoxX family protein [Mucilaginibacter hurinus]